MAPANKFNFRICESNLDKDNFTETDTGEREEWMILADLKFNEKDKTEQPCVNQTDFNIAEDRSFYTTE